MRKLRTRQHFIEDLGFNYIEKQLLLARCTLRSHHIDYGYDTSIVTYKNTGEIENGEISLQLKSTDNIQSLKDKEVYTFDLSKRDLELWLDNILSVILLLYDATSDRFLVYVNTKFDSVILLPLKKDIEKVNKARFSTISFILSQKGVIKHENDLAKWIEQNRLATV